MEYIVSVIFFFLGGIVQGCLGFGLAMVVVPPLLMVLPQTTVVPTMILGSMMNTSLMAWHLRSYARRNIVLPLCVGAAFGLPLGIYLLKTLEGPIFKIGVAVFMIALAGILLSGWSRPVRNPHFVLYPVGFFSGLLSGSISISGPPVILFLTSQETDKEVFRANIAAYFTLSGVLATTGFALSGLLTIEVFRLVVVLLPAVLTGTYIGAKAATRVSQTTFQRLTLFCVIVMGLVLLLRNVYELI